MITSLALGVVCAQIGYGRVMAARIRWVLIQFGPFAGLALTFWLSRSSVGGPEGVEKALLTLLALLATAIWSVASLVVTSASCLKGNRAWRSIALPLLGTLLVTGWCAYEFIPRGPPPPPLTGPGRDSLPEDGKLPIQIRVVNESPSRIEHVSVERSMRFGSAGSAHRELQAGAFAVISTSRVTALRWIELRFGPGLRTGRRFEVEPPTIEQYQRGMLFVLTVDAGDNITLSTETLPPNAQRPTDYKVQVVNERPQDSGEIVFTLHYHERYKVERVASLASGETATVLRKREELPRALEVSEGDVSRTFDVEPPSPAETEGGLVLRVVLSQHPDRIQVHRDTAQP